MPAGKTPWFLSPKILIVLIAVALWGIIPILPSKLAFNGSDFKFDLSSLWTSPKKPAAEVKKTATVLKPVDPLKLLKQTAVELGQKIALHPDDPALYNQLGLIQLSLNETDDAIAQFNKAKEVSLRELAELHTDAPGQVQSTAAVVESSRLLVELAAARGNLLHVYESSNRPNEAAVQLRELSQESLTGVFPAVEKATVKHDEKIAGHLDQGNSLMRKGALNEAMQEFREVVAVTPDSALAHHQLGLAAALSQNTHLAKKEFQAATNLKPSDAIGHYNLGVTYQSLGKSAQAEHEFHIAAALDPKLWQAELSLGNLYAMQDKLAQAQHAYRRALTRNPKSAAAHNNLASILSLQGHYEPAIEEFQEALSINSESASSHYGLGLALFKSKSYKQSIQEFKRALALDPTILDAQHKIEIASHKA